MAPISMPPSVSLIPDSSGIAPRSTTASGPLHAVLEPVEGVHPAGQHPGRVAVTVEDFEGAVQALGLVQLEVGDHVVDDGHAVVSSL